MRIDPLTQGFLVLAGMIVIYLAPYGMELFVPLALLVVGGFLMWVMGKKMAQDEYIDSGESRTIVTYTLIAIIGAFVANVVGVTLFRVPASIVIFADAVLLSVLAAISEEFFFRGFVLRFMLWKTKSFFFAILINAAIFAVYHFKRYGTQPDALFVMLAVGTILGYVAWKTRRLTPVILAHIINNVWAVMGAMEA